MRSKNNQLFPKNIFISGASSGIGAALSIAYAKPGNTLFLQGRNEERLRQIKALCEEKGAQIHTFSVDVTDKTAMENYLHQADELAIIDLIIANAGISAGTGQHGETAEQARRIFQVNVDGVFNTIHPLLPRMRARNSGQIAIISSLAGIRALPSSPAYSASKAAVRYYGESIRGWLGREGVKVNVICPGYIKTPMTAVNNFPMPFIMSADKAAQLIVRGLAKNRGRIAFPRKLYWPLWWLACLSPRITDPIFAALPAKPSE